MEVLWKRCWEEGLKWVGYSDGDGESVRITIYKGKPLESQVESLLTNVGNV
jgi:hypothetical protein